MTFILVLLGILLAGLTKQWLLIVAGIAAAGTFTKLRDYWDNWRYHRKHGRDLRCQLEKQLVDIRNKLNNLPGVLRGILSISISFDLEDRAIIKLVAAKGYESDWLWLTDDRRYPPTMGGPRDETTLIPMFHGFFREIETAVDLYNSNLLDLKQHGNLFHWDRLYVSDGFKYFELDSSGLGKVAEEKGVHSHVAA